MKHITSHQQGAEELARLIDREVNHFGIIRVDFTADNFDYYSAKILVGGIESENWENLEGRMAVESVSITVTQFEILEAFVYTKDSEHAELADLLDPELKKVFNLK